MAISISMYVLALNGAGLVGGLLLTSAVIMLSVHQDLGLKVWIGAFFGFFMALVFGFSALVEAIRVNLRGGAAFCMFCVSVQRSAGRSEISRVNSQTSDEMFRNRSQPMRVRSAERRREAPARQYAFVRVRRSERARSQRARSQRSGCAARPARARARRSALAAP